jgi:hypothetical protein
MAARYDMIEMKAEVDPHGFIRDKPVVTRSGVFKYRVTGNHIRREYRPEAEVFNPASLQSLAGIPVTDSHRGLVSADNPGGIIGAVTSPGERVDDNVLASLVIHDAKRLGKRRELSLGYVCDVAETPGEHGGERYDCVQTNIRYNHLAVVDKGRAGVARLRLDADDGASESFEQEDEMADPKLISVRLDEIDYQAAPEVANALRKRDSDYTTLKTKFDQLEAERDTLKTAATKHADDLKKVREDSRGQLKQRLELETTAEANGIKCDENDSDRSIKEKVIAKLNSELRLDGKSDDYVDSAYDIVLEAAKTRKVSKQMQTTSRADGTTQDPGTGSAAARERMLKRIRGEKVDEKAA